MTTAPPQAPAAGASLLPPDLRTLILSCGKAGHDANSLGIAAALGLSPRIHRIAPRRLYSLAAPYGPADPRDVVDADWPQLVIASGRETAPVLRAYGARNRAAFTLYLQDPRAWRSAYDMIWTPAHDSAQGPNIVKTLLSPHPLRPHALAQARAHPDPRIAALDAPRLALMIGGPSKAHRFEERDAQALIAIARQGAAQGFSIMATPSRRTPPDLMRRLAEALADLPSARRFLWDGAGDNPYLSMLANAQAILVTADSVNMVGEAAATGAPTHVYEPSGGAPKITRFLEGVIAAGLARRYAGAFESWASAPSDPTDEIAREAARRILAKSSKQA